MDDAKAAIVASRLDEGSAREALQRLIAALLEVEDRYRFLLSQDILRTSHQDDGALEERLGRPIRRLFERGRAAGEFSRSLRAD